VVSENGVQSTISQWHALRTRPITRPHLMVQHSLGCVLRRWW